MREIISGGVDYPLEDLSEEDRKGDLEYMIIRGDHRSAMKPRENFETLKSNYQVEVQKEWMLPLPTSYLRRVRGGAVIPVGVHSQVYNR